MAMIFTTLGMVEETTLDRKDVVLERSTGIELATEWWSNGVLVKRDAHFIPTQPAVIQRIAP